ncbi:MAG TPA: DUF58 domain-containing protein [Candidatus Rubrimentiphilum sp.]|nr:DUF58 domain-containing protein [Candidatus Rubrimentiphilum sp.]
MKQPNKSRIAGGWFSPRAYWMLAILVALLGVAGFAPGFAFLAQTWAAIFVAGLLADALLGPRGALIAIEREQPEPFSLRRNAALRYRVTNRSRIAIRATLIESPSTLLRYGEDEVALAVPARSEALAERAVTPVARGSSTLTAIYAGIENPIGLWRRRRRVSQAQPVRVYPDLSAVERYGALHVRNRLIEAGLRRMRLRGSGTELENLRDWSQGDQFRSIDWKATARRGKLTVADYEVERSQNVMIVLDAGRLMTARVDEQRKFDYAITAALSVASIASLANDKVGVVAFASEILRASAPRSSRRSLAQLSGELHDVEPLFEESDYAQAFAYVRSHVNKRSLIVFFTDMVDPVAQSTVLAQIGTLAKRHLVVCVFMNDRAIDRVLESEPHSAKDVYATSVALELRDERRAAAAILERLGVQVIDVPARELTTALIDRYLLVKQRGLL